MLTIKYIVSKILDYKDVMIRKLDQFPASIDRFRGFFIICVAGIKGFVWYGTNCWKRKHRTRGNSFIQQGIELRIEGQSLFTFYNHVKLNTKELESRTKAFWISKHLRVRK